MNDVVTLLLAFIWGLAIGTFFFGGLWWTVRRSVVSPRPALWFLGSGAARMSAALGGFYLVSGHEFARLIACLIGFVVARVAVAGLARPPPEGGRHAP